VVPREDRLLRAEDVKVPKTASTALRILALGIVPRLFGAAFNMIFLGMK
jgi:hypothetical protein